MKRISFMKFMLTVMFMVTALCAYSQTMSPMHIREFNKSFTNVDTLVLENIPTIEPTTDGDYLIALPEAGYISIAYNDDKTNAIVSSVNGFRFVPPIVYNVKDDERRLILWYKDDNVYCGYVYDKRFKAGQYYYTRDKKERKKIVSRLPFMKDIPRFVR